MHSGMRSAVKTLLARRSRIASDGPQHRHVLRSAAGRDLLRRGQPSVDFSFPQSQLPKDQPVINQDSRDAARKTTPPCQGLSIWTTPWPPKKLQSTRDAAAASGTSV
jgi:hypothetical protein